MNAKAWLKKEMQKLFDEDGQQKPFYDVLLNDFMQKLWDIDPKSFKHADAVNCVLSYQAAYEGLTRSTLDRARLLCGMIDLIHMAHAVKPLLKKPCSIVEKNILTRYKAMKIYMRRNEFIYGTLDLYAYNAGVEALKRLVDVPELDYFKIRRLQPIDTTWENQTIADYEDFTDRLNVDKVRFEEFFNYFNTAFLWVLQQPEYSFLLKPTPFTPSKDKNKPIVRKIGDDFTLDHFKAFDYLKCRPTEDTINRIMEGLSNASKKGFVPQVIGNYRLQLLENETLIDMTPVNPVLNPLGDVERVYTIND